MATALCGATRSLCARAAFLRRLLERLLPRHHKNTRRRHCTVPPSSCDKAQFIADVTVPDGTVMLPGATFTKTWRLKNVGTCAWTTAYQLVFFSGEQMGAASSAAFPKNVAVGETVDISINMTAPSAAGSYRGYWMFKNASGALFGIGTQANKPWWVDIIVSGPTVTPGGPPRRLLPLLRPVDPL